MIPLWRHNHRRRSVRPAEALSRDPMGNCLFCGGRPEDQCPCDLVLAAYDLRVAPELTACGQYSRRGRPWRRLLQWLRQR